MFLQIERFSVRSLKNVLCESPKAARGYAVRDGKDLQRRALFNLVKSVSVRRERSVDVNSIQFITAQYILILTSPDNRSHKSHPPFPPPTLRSIHLRLLLCSCCALCPVPLMIGCDNFFNSCPDLGPSTRSRIQTVHH